MASRPAQHPRSRDRGRRAPSRVGLLLLGAAAGCSFDVGGLDLDGGSSAADARRPADARVQSAPDARPPVDADLDRPGTLVSTPTATPPVLDADPQDWAAARWQYFAMADADLHANCAIGYDDSMSIRFASMHDATFIYFFLSVSDDYVVTDGPDLPDDDTVVLYLDAAGDRSGPYGWDDHKLALSDGYWRDYADLASDVALNGDYALTQAGFDFEVRIRKDSLGVYPLGAELGLDVMLSDDDTWGETDCWGYWHIAAGPHCGTCCEGETSYPGCDTTTLGALVLL